MSPLHIPGGLIKQILGRIPRKHSKSSQSDDGLVNSHSLLLNTSSGSHSIYIVRDLPQLFAKSSNSGPVAPHSGNGTVDKAS